MKRFGLLGEKLGHSYSPQIHRLLGAYEYPLYEKSADEVAAFLQHDGFDGINVTIPYKKTVMPFCAELSDTARRIGSVNTVVRRADGTLAGFNTDYDGFRWMVARSGIDVAGKTALVLGSGGASLTVRTVLADLGAKRVTVISRRGEHNYDNMDRTAQIIANATPVGMYPNVGAAPVDLAQFPNCEGVLDVIYNPARTQLLLDAERLGIPHENGLSMLVAQAKRSAELFLGTAIDDGVTERILGTLARQMRNLVLIGMPGCGKSTAGAAVAQALGRRFVDADAEIVRAAGCSIPEIFAKKGEAGFRARETAVLAELGKQSGLVIATGGGCVTQPRNYPLLHQNGWLIWMQRPADELPRDGRPLSAHADLAQMAAQREPLYRLFADASVPVASSPAETQRRILEAQEKMRV